MIYVLILHYWNKTLEVINLKRRKVYFGAILEVSVHDWLDPLLLGLCRDSKSWQENLVGRSCLPHSIREAKKRGKEKTRVLQCPSRAPLNDLNLLLGLRSQRFHHLPIAPS
jgi:hypothetical protein